MAANWLPGTKLRTGARRNARLNRRKRDASVDQEVGRKMSAVARFREAIGRALQELLERRRAAYLARFSGNRQPNYGSLQPGEDRKQTTGAGHAWLIADAAGNELGHFVAGKRDAQAVITGAGAIDILSARTGERLSRLNSDSRLGLEPGRHTNRDCRRQGLGDSHREASRQRGPRVRAAAKLLAPTASGWRQRNSTRTSK